MLKNKIITRNTRLDLFIIVFTFLLGLGLGIPLVVNEVPIQVQDSLHNSMPPTELSPEEYTTIKDEFTKISIDQNPKIALTELRKRIETNTALLRSCHALVHDIGRSAYKKYGDFAEAMKYQNEICNSGYLHGVIESHFARSADVSLAMKDVCNPYPIGKYLSWECYHGVGHGAMFFTSNNLPKSLELCTEYINAFARTNCINGVFMENFNTDQKLHPSKFLKISDPFYPCNEQTSTNKGICYVYAPTYFLSIHEGDYVDALNWCNDAEFFYKNSCAQGVGSQAIKENIHDPKLVEKICMKGKSTQIVPCIEGMIGLYINHSGSLEPAKKLCEQLEIKNKQTCYNSIASSASLF